MRWKIIAVNAGIVLVVGALCYILLAASLSNVLANQEERKEEIERALRAANAQLSLDALRTQRWMTEVVDDPEVEAIYAISTLSGKQDKATQEANRLRDAAVQSPLFAKMSPTLVMFVDASGKSLGRNGSSLLRGVDVVKEHPQLQDAMKERAARSDLWLDEKSVENALVSYAPIENAAGELLGALVVGTPLNDDRLKRTSDLTSGRKLLVATISGDRIDVVARSQAGDLSGLGSGQLAAAATKAVKSSSVAVADVPADPAYVYGAAPMEGYGRTEVALVAAVPAALVSSMASVLWPVIGVTILGIVLVVVGGILLGNYFSRPISELEDGILAVINGRADLRFQIEHAELGGLVFRINSLLNAMMGVPEDNTDETGRPSRPPARQDFLEALAVDDSMAASPETTQQLAREDSAHYYDRVFAEYIVAKKRVGDPTDHITQEAFIERLKKSEADMLAKHGVPVRYQVEVKDKKVVLMAVHLGAYGAR